VRLSETTYGRRHRAAPHAHLDATLAFVVAGGFSERQGSRQIECGPASVLLRPPAVEHDDTFANDGAACFNIELGAELLAERPVARVDVRGGEPTWSATRLLVELRDSSPPDPLALETRVAELLDALSPAPVAKMPTRIRRVMERLEDEFAARWSLGDLARAEDVHPVFLARSFRQACGESVGGYVRRLRLEHASRQLAGTSHPVADVARLAGFADQAHLTRVFRRSTGLTPARFRAALRGGKRFRSFKT
jgi:AraC family transcriptional regulator